METKKAWYELDEKERLKVFSKHTIKDFWDWWSDGEYRVMEVRIKDFVLIKEVALKFNLPYSSSGVYVHNDKLLKAVIGYTRDKATIWFGINPKKKNWNMWGKKVYAGRDEYIKEVGFIFIDIDRARSTGGAASKSELKNADKLARLILLALSTEEEEQEKKNWTHSYCKICSGNGVQLLIKLDMFVKLPELIFNADKKIYEFNPQFEREKELIRKGFGEQLLKFTKKFKKELGVVVDSSVFNVGRVGALPFTKNYKYGGFTWRGIIELEEGKNQGLTNYLLSVYDAVKATTRYPVFGDTSALRTKEIISNVEQLEKHPLTQLLLNPKLQKGGGKVNNVLWMFLKVLIRDNLKTDDRDDGIDMTSKEFIELHKKLEKNYGNPLTTNLPNKKTKYNTNPINKYCREHLFPPIPPLWPNKNVSMFRVAEVTLDEAYLSMGEPIIYKEGVDPLEDCKKFKKEYLSEKDPYRNKGNVLRFTSGLIKKYNKDVAKYYVTYLYDILFNHDYSVNSPIQEEE